MISDPITCSAQITARAGVLRLTSSKHPLLYRSAPRLELIQEFSISSRFENSLKAVIGLLSHTSDEPGLDGLKTGKKTLLCSILIVSLTLTQRAALWENYCLKKIDEILVLLGYSSKHAGSVR